MSEFQSAMPREIFPISNTTLVVFIPNLTATHAIKYINLLAIQLAIITNNIN